MNSIRLLLVDSREVNRVNLRRILASDSDIDVIGEAKDGQEAIQKVKALSPDIVLMNSDLPKMDGISATEKIYLENPGCAVIIMSDLGDHEEMRRAMLAGARSFQGQSFEPDEILENIKKVYFLESKRNGTAKGNLVYSKPHVVTVFGTKGGVGKTTVAVNLAVLLAEKKKKVALVDLDLQFGDVTVFLNILPRRTIAELVQEDEKLDIEIIENYLHPHISGIKVLPAPGRPEYAELITGAHIEKIISVLKTHYDYVIIDTPPLFNETNLSALELSTQVFLVLSLDMATLKNTKLSLELMSTLHQKGKTKLVLNRVSEEVGIKVADAEEALSFLVAAQVPSDPKLAFTALNKGVPFVLSHPSARVSQALRGIADLVTADRGYQEDLNNLKKKKGLLGKLLITSNS